MIEIIGKVVLKHTHEISGYEDKPKDCVCCPGARSHVYQRIFELPEYTPDRFSTSLRRSLDFWIKSNFDFMKLEGHRIRVTAELVEDDDVG
jgi:hypothetical protein